MPNSRDFGTRSVTAYLTSPTPYNVLVTRVRVKFKEPGQLCPLYHNYTARKRITRPTMKSFLVKVVYFQVLFEIIGWFSIRPGTANRRLESGALAGITIVAPTCS